MNKINFKTGSPSDKGRPIGMVLGLLYRSVKFYADVGRGSYGIVPTKYFFNWWGYHIRPEISFSNQKLQPLTYSNSGETWLYGCDWPNMGYSQRDFST